MRIVAGSAAGWNLVSPAARVRATAEPVRVAIFTALGGAVRDARVLDLFAGSGALGLEAISRGARSADFVESGAGALHALRANVASLRLRERARIFKRDAVLFAEALDADRYDIAFADPPYGSRVLDRILAAWQARPFARILVAEHARTHELPAGAERLALADTIVTIYRG